MAISVDNNLNQNYNMNTAAATSEKNDSSIDDNTTSGVSSSTDKGTSVVRSNGEIDKNMFLKILAAELANQDPTDSNSESATQYVSQLAQFSSLEQMANLNSTNKLNSANSLINKYVTFSDLADDGGNYSGQVEGVIKDGDDISLNTLIGQDSNGNGVYKSFNLDDVVKVDDLGDAFDPTANNNLLLNATSLIGKKVEINEKDKDGNDYSGVVQSVSRGTGGVIVKVKTGDGETKDFYFDQVSNVENA
ncbi:MAG TPA: flagellar biosynthesis protein FlgD [Clostridium sp.]|jgi:flagellar basal-body rod modification protein FlgD|uniref:Basal-body rod modification protein FlgD n=1 Tax=Clostridium lapidicellarium TaxID=3240931 RepID=A0ABV4DTH3_9CLOT|nr:flagellar biosynthesis protein FlgD [Clostridium sp.]